MNKHKEKCEHLKEIRKNMADALGVDLNQTECTYEGECKGTCPKCQQEEQKLSRALLKGTAVAASAALMMSGCTIEPYATTGVVPNGVEYQEELEGEPTLEEESIEVEGLIPATELEGDVAFIPEEME